MQRSPAVAVQSSHRIRLRMSTQRLPVTCYARVASAVRRNREGHLCRIASHKDRLTKRHLLSASTLRCEHIDSAIDLESASFCRLTPFFCV